MAVIRTDGLEDQSEGLPIINEPSDGHLDDQHEGQPNVLFDATTVAPTTIDPTTISPTTVDSTTLAPTTYSPVVILTSPLDLSTGEGIPVTLDWEAYPGADLYQVQVSTVLNFLTTVLDETTVNTYYNATILDLAYNTHYYWRVRARLA